jgi:hypothetical protein
MRACICCTQLLMQVSGGATRRCAYVCELLMLPAALQVFCQHTASEAACDNTASKHVQHHFLPDACLVSCSLYLSKVTMLQEGVCAPA